VRPLIKVFAKSTDANVVGTFIAYTLLHHVFAVGVRVVLEGTTTTVVVCQPASGEPASSATEASRSGTVTTRGAQR
jgi:hypothetical protein